MAQNICVHSSNEPRNFQNNKNKNNHSPAENEKYFEKLWTTKFSNSLLEEVVEAKEAIGAAKNFGEAEEAVSTVFKVEVAAPAVEIQM